MYYPLRNTCAQVLATVDGGLAIYRLAAKFQIAPGTDQLGTVRAISAETGKTIAARAQLTVVVPSRPVEAFARRANCVSRRYDADGTTCGAE
jgi:hypothetical protein